MLHRPAEKMTVQIGDAAALARAIHIPVMHDFRAADVAAGGQGAPLVPVYHRALAQSLEREGPVVVVNIGGVSNITYIDGADTLIACDTGPGNALLDDFMHRTIGQPFDCEGRMAAQGTVNVAWIADALNASVLHAAAAEIARPQRFRRAALPAMSPADGAATLTALDGGGDRPDRAAVAEAAKELDRRRRRRAQSHDAADAARAAAPATVEAADALGWSADAIEAQAFGFLAARGLKGLPLSYPATTGVPIPMTGGVIARP